MYAVVSEISKIAWIFPLIFYKHSLDQIYHKKWGVFVI